MERFKRVMVILLPSENKKNALWSYKERRLYSNEQNNPNDEDDTTYYHLYFISDEQPKEDDWCMVIDKTSSLYGIYEQHKGVQPRDSKWGKIIASTDTNLVFIKHNETVPYPQGKQIWTPKPSETFVQKYVELHNSKKVITDILVEYEEKSIKYIKKELGIFGHDESFLLESEYQEYLKTNSIDKLKVNPKDNTITIKKLKDSWSREEVKGLLWKCYTKDISPMSITDINTLLIPKFNNWVKENLQ